MFPKFDIGKSGENFVKYIIKQASFECELNNDYEKRYDYDLSVKMGKKKFTIECKYDIYSVKSGNIAIEHYNCKSECDSGINSTLADIWAHIIPDKNSDDILAYAISVKKLKEFVEQTQPHKEIVAGGDKNSNMYLYKKEIILPEFKRFDNITDPKTMKSLFLEMLK